MINKEQFIKLINDYQHWLDRMEEVYTVLNSPNLFEADWIEYTNELFSNTIAFLFNEDGADDISWWLFEKSDGICMWDETGKAIPTDTVEDLWNIVKDSRK